MPTADQYRGAAHLLRCAADECDKTQGWFARSASHGVRGGTLAVRADRAVATPQEAAAGLRQRYLDVAVECDRRAVVCDQFAAAVASAGQARDAYIAEETNKALMEQRPADVSGAPQVPSPPCGWVVL